MAAVDTSVLELIRKTIYGGPMGGILDFNNIFSPSSSSNVAASVARDIFNSESPGGGPANNASAESTPASSAVGNAIGAMVANAVMSAINPLAPMAVQTIANTPSTLSALQAIAHSQDALSVDTNAPESPNANDAGLSQAADSQAASEADTSGGDSSGDGGATGATSGAAGDAGDGSGDSGGGAYANGGFVPGHDITGSDSQTIHVSGGEAIIPTNIVDMLGKNFFEKILLTRSPFELETEKRMKGSGK